MIQRPHALEVRFSPRRFRRRPWLSGSSRFGLLRHSCLRGSADDGRDRVERLYIIARRGHGPYIPCTPAIILAERLVREELTQRGARPCLDLMDLDEFIAALGHLDVTIVREADHD